jgi:hypothetical protein
MAFEKDTHLLNKTHVEMSFQNETLIKNKTFFFKFLFIVLMLKSIELFLLSLTLIELSQLLL